MMNRNMGIKDEGIERIVWLKQPVLT